jgi:hypothetical protein
MRRTGVVLGLVLMSAAASADTERTKRILSDAVLKGVVKGAEARYAATCVLPKESEISWRCLNGPQCGYVVSVRCTPKAKGAKGSWQLEVQGFDDGKVNDVNQITLGPTPPPEPPADGGAPAP